MSSRASSNRSSRDSAKAKAKANSSLELEGEFESELEGFGEGEGEFESELEGELEGELEFEGEFEGLNPVNRIYPDAMMEHMGLAAMEAESEFEAAEHFLPLIPMVASKLLPLAAKALPKIAGKVLPRVARTIARATPRLTRGVTHLARALHRNPQTRHLVRAIPSVARRTVASIVKQAAKGRPVTPATALRILHKQRRHVLGNSKIRRHALRRSHLMDHRFHRAGGYGLLPRAHHRGYRSWGPGGWSWGRRAGVQTTGLGPRHMAQGLPARFHAPVGVGVSRAHVCANCGGVRSVRRVCCCC